MNKISGVCVCVALPDFLDLETTFFLIDFLFSCFLIIPTVLYLLDFEVFKRVQPGEKKAPERLYSSLVPTGHLQKSWGGTFVREGSDKKRGCNFFKLKERFRLDMRK